MDKKKGKRAQFYLLAAVIVVLVIMSLSSVVTYSIIRSQPKSTQELSQNLRTESPNVIRYGIFNNQNMSSLMQNFTEADFANYQRRARLFKNQIRRRAQNQNRGRGD